MFPRFHVSAFPRIHVHFPQRLGIARHVASPPGWKHNCITLQRIVPTTPATPTTVATLHIIVVLVARGSTLQPLASLLWGIELSEGRRRQKKAEEGRRRSEEKEDEYYLLVLEWSCPEH